MHYLARVLLHLTCWALSFQRPQAAAWSAGSAPAFSASLLYIYATDSIYWPHLTGKLLKDNDTLLILPGVVYKVWCEVLPEGRPRLYSNNKEVIAHQPIPWKTMTHVELHRNLFHTLDGLDRESGNSSEPVKLWCDYTDGSTKLRTTVTLQPFAVANTTCNYSTVSGLAVEESLLNFTCTSWSGYPRPEHSCVIVTDQGRDRSPAQIVSVTSPTEGRVVTVFSLLASRSNHQASIECSTSQQLVYEDSERHFKESHAQTVRPLGESYFTFVKESAKHCEMTLAGDYAVTILCKSTGGLPATDHSCRSVGINGSETLPLMEKVQDATYVTELAFNNSWAYQNGTVTCVLQQQFYSRKIFSFRVPGFRRSAKSCKFSHLSEGVQARCFSGAGLPSSHQHSCVIRLGNGTTAPTASDMTRQDGTLVSTFLVLRNALNRGSQIVCTVKQDGFPPEVFVHSVPRFTESRKACHFVNSSWEVKAVCEFSSGYPATRSECQLLVANSSVSLNLKVDQEKVDLSKQAFNNSYTVKLPGPDASYSGGRIVCRVFQGGMFVKTFAYRIAEHKPPTEIPELGMSSQTALTLGLALLVALLLLLLMSLPIHAIRRCLRHRKDLSRQSSYPLSIASIQSGNTAAHRSLLPPIDVADRPMTRLECRPGPPDFALHEILSDVCNTHGYRANRRDGMQDIDQYSMFEFGYQLDPNNKRKSVLADALLRCQMAQNRREFRFSM